MQVLTGDFIEFQEDDLGNPYAVIHGDYSFKEMSEAEFEAWAEDTGEDYLTQEYAGVIHLCKRVEISELFSQLLEV